jgi:hypothetical protein
MEGILCINELSKIIVIDHCMTTPTSVFLITVAMSLSTPRAAAAQTRLRFVAQQLIAPWCHRRLVPPRSTPGAFCYCNHTLLSCRYHADFLLVIDS